ncbi:MAG: PQQ-dependent sugar dehydrogenase [Cyclobacteriaceae bacterium]
MKCIFNLNNTLRLLLIWILLIACTSKRNEIKILLLADHDAVLLEEKLQELAATSGWRIETVSDPNAFNEDFLKEFSGVVTTFSGLGDLDDRSVTTLKRYLEAGGGGIVAVKDTTHSQNGWPWLAAWNNTQTGKQLQQDNGRVSILSSRFTSGELKSALTHAVGKNALPDYRKATTLAVPEASRYTYRVLTQGMDEPMEMAILPNNHVLIVERKGAVKLYNDSSKQTTTVAQFNVFTGIEDGLLGVALDPGYEKNSWVYFYYAVAGEKSINRLSRMEFRNHSLDMTSEKVLLEIPTQRIYCCHSAGYLAFDANGLLYLSTGDNTNAEETDGYIPIDERPGRGLSDDQATAANSNDLRGKILRIKPEPDGTYSIPDGNLFAKDGSEGRPEVYVMGCRNPYRFSIDKKTNYLYWGDVGPDTNVLASEGTLSYDEINQAKQPGFYGWPYFLGNNEAFPEYDYATKKEGPKFNPARPINNSPNNTGVKELPPAQPAMIWYGDGTSSRFPMVGKGGQSAMAGPVYYSDLFPSAKYKLPDYYDKKLFIYDWVRRWFRAVTLDDNGNYVRMEPFLDHLTFIAPTDMQFASDGAIYILEYGTNWFTKNSDARLLRIEYAEGNRKPVANIKVDNAYGAVPFEAQFSAMGSIDFDEKDVLQYTWQVEEENIEGDRMVHTFTRPGTYEVSLTVRDNHGEESRSSVVVKAGNAAPQIKIATRANRTFYWDNVSLDYKVRITDKEDEFVDPTRVNISLNFLPQGKDLAVILADPRDAGNVQFVKGKILLEQLDCKACHSIKQESVGPAYIKVAERYSERPGIESYLVEKIIQGGTGNWGERPMSAHPDLSVDDAKEIVHYILSLKDSNQSLPLESTVMLKDHLGKGNEGSYLLMASYTDGGANGVEPLYANAHIALRNPLIQIEDYDDGNVRMGTITTVFLTFATGIHHERFVKFNDLDLTHVKQLKYRVQSQGIGGNIEARLDKMDGKVISILKIPGGQQKDLKNGWKEMNSKLNESVSGSHDVYFVFTNPEGKSGNLFHVDWIYFGNR